MQDDRPAGSAPSEGAVAEAAEVAKGSGIAMGGNLINRGLRLVNTWQLSTALDVHYFGLYTSITTIVNILAYFAPLGMNSGITLFGARYRGSGEQDRLKGTLFLTFGFAAVFGVLVSLGYLAFARWYPWPSEQVELAHLMPYGAMSIAAWAILLVAVAALRVARDSVAQTSVYNVTLPILLTLFSFVATGAGWGVVGALVGFGIAHLLTFGEAVYRSDRHFGALVRDRSIRPVYEPAALLKFSIPESLSFMLFRLTQWMDQVLLTFQSTPTEVGIYKIASSLSLVGSIPAAALQTIFNATAAELLYTEQKERLGQVLHILTRWITAAGCAAYLGIVLGQDVAYAIFDKEYAAGSSSLIALLLGQLVYTTCMPVTSLIPMAGHARLNLLNGVAATSLNFVLNLVLIPRYGSLGSSVATCVTLVAWSLWRVAQVRHLMGYFPFRLGTVALMPLTIAAAWGLRWAIDGTNLLVHAAVTLGAVGVFVAVLWIGFRQPEDEIVVAPLQKRLRRLTRRLRRG